MPSIQDGGQQEIKNAGVKNHRGCEQEVGHVEGGRMTLSADVSLDYRS